VIEGDLSTQDLALVRRYISLNRQAIFDHWNEYTDRAELICALKSRLELLLPLLRLAHAIPLNPLMKLTATPNHELHKAKEEDIDRAGAEDGHADPSLRGLRDGRLAPATVLLSHL